MSKSPRRDYSYFLTPDELAEAAYQHIRSTSSTLLTSSEMTDLMLSYIYSHHYHIIAADILMACHERTGLYAD